MNILEYLKKQNVTHQCVPHPDLDNAGGLAASLGLPPESVAKTILLRANGGYRYIVAVYPAVWSVDLERLSALLGGTQLRVATELDAAAHCPDCEAGLVPPFGSQYAMSTVVDERLAREPEIVFAGNTREKAIRIRFEDYRQLETPLILDFATPLGEERELSGSHAVPPSSAQG